MIKVHPGSEIVAPAGPRALALALARPPLVLVRPWRPKADLFRVDAWPPSGGQASARRRPKADLAGRPQSRPQSRPGLARPCTWPGPCPALAGGGMGGGLGGLGREVGVPALGGRRGGARPGRGWGGLFILGYYLFIYLVVFIYMGVPYWPLLALLTPIGRL